MNSFGVDYSRGKGSRNCYLVQEELAEFMEWILSFGCM